MLGRKNDRRKYVCTNKCQDKKHSNEEMLDENTRIRKNRTKKKSDEIINKVEIEIRLRKNVYEKMTDEKMPDENMSWNPCERLV